MINQGLTISNAPLVLFPTVTLNILSVLLYILLAYT